MGLRLDIQRSRAPLAGLAVIAVAWASVFAQMPVLKSGIGASDGALGSALLMASVGAILAMWLAPWAHRIAKGYSLILGSVLVLLGFVSTGYAPGVIGFTVALGFMAAGAGIVDVLATAEISEGEADTGRALMNLNHALYSFVYAGAALLNGAMREAGWSPTQAFWWLSLPVLLLCLLMYVPQRVAPAEKIQSNQTQNAPLAFVVTAGAVVFVAFLAEAASEGWSALHIERTLGGGAGQGALGPALLGLSMGVGRLCGHFFAQRWDDIAVMRIALLISAAGAALAGGAPHVMVAYVGFALCGLGVSVVAPLALGLLGRSVPVAARLKAISRASALGYGAFFLGPPLMGFVAEGFGLRISFVVVALILTVIALLLVPLLGRQADQLRHRDK